ncbi:MAG: hypothetical protein Q9222_000638 [Ikaeria aurantiellina]
MTTNGNGNSSRTGQRVKRAVSFGLSPDIEASDADGTPEEERSPLLGFRKARSYSSSLPRLLLEVIRDIFNNAWVFAKSKTGKGVLKCSIAYLLGSLATLVPAIAQMLGQQDGKHMVATITVYFHPARSQGSMFEAMILAALAFLYAAFIGFTSMGVSILFGRVLDLIVLGHAIVLVVFCGGGLGFIGWIKQRLGHPLVNIACSLTSLAIITVLTKEGAVQAGTFSDDKITQVLKMILMGVLATTAVSFLIYPVSARTDLRESLISFTDSLSEILASTTQSFLVGSEEAFTSPQYRSMVEKYKNQLGAMEKNLTEAKYEHFVAGTENEYWLETKLVECMQRLAHNIGGLRSAATTQFVILAQPGLGTSPSVGTHLNNSAPFQHLNVLDVIGEASESGEGAPTGSLATPEAEPEPVGIMPADVFAEFITHLGPSIVSAEFHYSMPA